MSEIYPSIEMLIIAKEIIGKKESVEIDSNIYSHNFDRDNKDDLFTLGQNGMEITIDQLIETMTKIEKLVNEISYKTSRTYCFEGIEQISVNKYSISWGS